jgi:hypothetical protein
LGRRRVLGELTAGRRREPRCGPPPVRALVGDGAAEDAKRREREAVAVEMPAANLSVGERSTASAWTQRTVRPAVALGPLRGGQDVGRDDRAPDGC